MNIRLVCATRHFAEGFSRTPLGITLNSKRLLNVEPTIFLGNERGLGAVYNQFLSPLYQDRPILFVHDDVYLEDYWLAERVYEATEEFDVAGLVGQSFPSEVVSIDQPSHSHWDIGAVAMGTMPAVSTLNNPDHKGTWQEAYLIDGFFTMVNVKKVVDAGVHFDEQFGFAFYDRDFSRTVVNAGLSLGVAPVAVTHVSGVIVPGTPLYDKEVALYVQKWKGRS